MNEGQLSDLIKMAQESWKEFQAYLESDEYQRMIEENQKFLDNIEPLEEILKCDRLRELENMTLPSDTLILP